MTPVAIRAIGLCADGLPDWAGGSRLLAGAATACEQPGGRRTPEGLAPTERRRINETSRLAGLAACDAIAQMPSAAATTMPTIFTSADGDGLVLAQMLTALSQPDVVVSPTAFHNSVYNAPAGYWTIAARSTAASTTLCADEASFAVALLEGFVQVHSNNAPVLVVAVDAPFPGMIRGLGESLAGFACAFVLDSLHDDWPGPRIDRWRVVDRDHELAGTSAQELEGFGSNAAARSLPLLKALARRGKCSVALPYIDQAWLLLDVWS